MRLRFVPTIFALLTSSVPAWAVCPAQNTPVFSPAGGNVFGRNSGQWDQYFRSKADNQSGTMCDPILSGAANFQNAFVTGGTFSGATLSGGTATNLTLVNPLFSGTNLVTGPNPTTVNELASWNDTAGGRLRQGRAAITDNKISALTTAGATLSGFSQSGIADFYSSVFTSTNWSTHKGWLIIPNGTTVTNASPVSGFFRNQNPEGIGATSGDGVGLLGIGTCEVTGSACWGSNINILSGATYAIGTLTGVKLINHEGDISSVNPGDVIQYDGALGSSLVQPSFASGFNIGSLSVQDHSVAKWDFAFTSTSGTLLNTGIAYYVGALAETGNNVTSQPIEWAYTDGAGVSHGYKLLVNAAQGMSLVTTAGAGLASFAVDGNLLFGTATAGSLYTAIGDDVITTSTHDQYHCHSNNATACKFGNNTAVITLAGPLVTSCAGLPTGAPYNNGVAIVPCP